MTLETQDRTATRSGERNGWLFGWSGGFLWVLILAIVDVVRGKPLEAATGILIVCAAGAAIVWLAPWRHPETSYRRLMIPIYLLFAIAIVWGAWTAGGFRQLGFNSWFSLFLLLPLTLPLWTTGSRRWKDGA